LLREVVNRPGDLHTTLVRPSTDRQPNPLAARLAMLWFLAERPDLTGPVTSFTPIWRYVREDNTHRDYPVLLPAQARELLRRDPKRKADWWLRDFGGEEWWLGERSFPVVFGRYAAVVDDEPDDSDLDDDGGGDPDSSADNPDGGESPLGLSAA